MPVGKHKKIPTPELLWEHFQAYKKDTKENPILLHDFVGKDGDSVFRKKERPLTLEGFENWCADNEIIEDLGHYFANTDNRYEDYRTICSRIRKVIRQDHIEGGMAGIYNPSITQRLNNIIEKKEIENNSNVTLKTPDFLFNSNPLANDKGNDEPTQD